jgi:hypothetical protein
MVAFAFRSSALLLPWLCAGLVVAVLVDGTHASRPQQPQKQLRAGSSRHLQEAALLSDAPSLVPSQPPSDAPSMVPSHSPTAAPTDAPSDSPSNVPSSIPSDMPSAVPNSTASAPPSDVPSINSSDMPSDLPSAVPSATPNTTPSNVPSISSSDMPSDLPSAVPSTTPNTTPSNIPSDLPSAIPSTTPSATPSAIPSDAPSITPSDVPSIVPSPTPSATPSAIPSDLPSITPSDVPSIVPSTVPSATPSAIPSDVPSITPSDVPSIVPSPTPTSTPTAIPSDVPSITPSDLPSIVPSPVPTTTPSDGPSYVPSDAPSIVPSPAPSAAPSGLPSDIPSQVPSAAPSGLPSDIPSQVPSVAPSAAPSVSPSGLPSDIPSGAPSNLLSDMPSDVPSLAPSRLFTAATALKESVFTAKPSGNPTDAPTPRPSGAPSRVPSSMPSATPSTAPSYATEYVAVDALNLRVSADSIMDAATIAMFEEECSAFLPTFLPAVYPAKFQFVECEVLSQSIVDMSYGRRRLQQADQDLKWLAILVRVSARADLPGNIRFGDLVGQVFGTFGTTLQRSLNRVSPYFGNTSTLVPSADDGSSNTVSSSTRGDAGADDNTVAFPIFPVVGAAVVGAVLAIGMAAFMLSVKRGRGEDGILPRHSTTISVESFVIDGDNDDHKTGTQLSESTTGLFLPPTPIGVRSVPDEIASESFVEPEDALSPNSTSSASRHTSKEVEYQYYPGLSPDVLGLGRTGTTFARSRSERQGSETEKTGELDRSYDSSFMDDPGLDPFGSSPGVSQSVSAVDRSLQAVKRKTRDESKWDMDVMKLIGSGSPTVAAGNVNVPYDEARDQFVVNPLPRRNFFGFAMGFRNQKETKDSLPHDRAVAPAPSVDVSIDPMRAAGTPVGTVKNTFKECRAESPQGWFLQKNETPSGREFLQINVTSAAHTGLVLDDLGQSEEEWKGKLNTTLSATAPTPRADNTKSATPSAGGFLKMNVTSAAHTGNVLNVLDDLGKSEEEWKGQLSATMSATAETPRVGNTESANSHRSRRQIFSDS